MFALIFGRLGCVYCVRAKELAEKLAHKYDNFKYRYVDIHEEGIRKIDLEKIVGRSVNTVPQILVDKKYIGGFSDFEDYISENLHLFTSCE